MASISIVDGQGDNLNLHINAIKNNCSKTFDGESKADLDIDKSASQPVFSEVYIDNKILSSPLSSMENGGNSIEDKENNETQIKICPNKPCEAEEQSTSCTLPHDQININNLQSKECCSFAQPVNSNKTDNLNECSQDKSNNKVETHSNAQLEQSELTNLNVSENYKLALVSQKPDSLDTSDIVPSHSDDTELSVLDHSNVEIKDNIVSFHTSGDQLKGCTKNLTNHLEDWNTSNKSDSAGAIESVGSCHRDNMSENQMKTDDASDHLNLSEDDFLKESENQENNLSENVDRVACDEDMEMSDIKIAESLSIPDSYYVSDAKDLNMCNKDSNEKGVLAASVELDIEKCKNDSLIDITGVNSENTDSELEIVILESGSVAELASENNISDGSVNCSIELTNPKSDTESLKEPTISHSDLEDTSTAASTLFEDNLLDDNQIESVSEEKCDKEISLNDRDKLCDSLDKKDDALDTEDDILLMDDEETSEISCNPNKYSFKNILKKPKEHSINSKFPSEDINSIIIDDDEIVEPVKESEDIQVNKNVDVDFAKSEVDVSKIEKNRKRSLLVQSESNSSKRHKQDSSQIETKDAVITDAAVGNGIIISDDEKQIAIKEGAKEEMCPSNIQTSTEVLQAFMNLHLRAFLKNQKRQNMEKLNRRTRNMQSACSLWKETAKHLEKSVVELTALSQKLDKESKALKKLSQKSVGTQVNETKAKTSSPAVTPSTLNKTMPIYQTTATPSQPQSAKAKNLSNNGNQTVNKNHTAQPTTTPQRKVASKPAALPVTVPKTSPSQRQTSAPSSRVQPQVGRTPSSLQGNNLLDTNNLIDLTDEDDVSKKAQKPVAQTTPKPAVAKNLLPSAANGYNTSLHVGAQDILYTASSNQVALNPVQNSQLIALPPLPTGSPFHLIPINNTVQTANKTPMYALLSGPRPALSIASPNTNTRPVVSTNIAPATNATTTKSTARTLPPSLLINNQHPAPLPSNPDAGNAPPTAKKRPPKPGLKISKVTQGIVLSWNMPSLNDVEKILSYQLFAYQETENSVAKYSLWKKVGDVKALPLPMACTLTQFQEGNRYHFAVRAVDQYGRCGEYSDPSSIFLGPKT